MKRISKKALPVLLAIVLMLSSGMTCVYAAEPNNDSDDDLVTVKLVIGNATVINAAGWKKENGSFYKNLVNEVDKYGTLPKIQKKGYHFIGWKEVDWNTKESEVIVSDHNYNYCFNIPVLRSNMIVYKYYWSDDPGLKYVPYWDKTHTITFNPNKGKCSKKTKTVFDSICYDVKYDNDGNRIKEASYEGDSEMGKLPTPTRAKCKFAGWYTKKIKGNKKTSSDYVRHRNWTLYAHWKYPIKITYKPNKGKLKTKVKKTYTNQKIGKLAKPTRKHYKFLGWYTKKSGGKKITSSTKLTVEKNITLYAHWKRK